MSENSKIEWTDHTFNTHWGCSEISPGCDGCYAKALAKRFGYGWGDDAPKREFGESHWEDLLRWDRKAAAEGVRRRVFTNSMSDLFDKFAPVGVRERHWSYVERTPNLDHLLLTKRIGNVVRMVPSAWLEPGAWPSNVWLGATIVNQEEADRDIPKLLAVPATKRFLSMEPLLAPVDLLKWLDPFTCADCGFHGSENDCGPDGCAACGEPFGSETTCVGCGADDQSAKPSCTWCGSHRSFERDHGLKFDTDRKLIDWVICGGESGPGARAMHPEWARSLRDQCEAASTPFLFKQWGEWHTDAYLMSTGEAVFRQFDSFQQWVNKASTWVHGGICLDVDGRELRNGGDMKRASDEGKFPITIMHKTGKKAAGRLLDGVTHDAFPASQA